MPKDLKAATLFSGIGAPEVSMPSWDWLWHAEIEKFPTAVMKERHPESINLGDVSAENFVARGLKIGRPDVLVFGSPCQDFSVAGGRIGLDGARGNMALLGVRLARELGIKWVVFENVPGLLSSYSGGAEAERDIREGPIGRRRDCQEDSDFAALLSAFRECGYFGAYRVFDAQFAGVPQRRRRIFFVGYLGDWRPPASILFEPSSMRGDRPPSRAAGQKVAGSIRASAARRGGIQDEADSDGLIADSRQVAGSVSAKWSKGTGGPAGDECYNLVPFCAGSVRRLTPRECERLQAFPDDYTLIIFRGKPAADGPRYRSLGNSMCVKDIGAILERIDTFEAQKKW